MYGAAKVTHVALVSALYGGYDTPVALPRQEDVGRVSAWMFTDDERLQVPGWRTCWMPRPDVAPRLAAKSAKAVPFPLLPASVDVVIWVDAHVQVTSPHFAASLLADLGDAPWGMFRHHQNRTLTEELALSHVTGKYVGQDIDGQVAAYLAAGCPNDYGIWMTGLFVRRRDPAIEQMGHRWIDEQYRWSVQDQLSLPFVAWEAGLAPVDLPFEGWWTGTRFMLGRHVDGSG